MVRLASLLILVTYCVPLLGQDRVGPFVRGDCNGNGYVTNGIASSHGDALKLLRWMFLGDERPPCLAACDANGDGRVLGTVTDAIYIYSYNARGGHLPPAPFPDCAYSINPNDVALGCGQPLTESDPDMAVRRMCPD